MPTKYKLTALFMISVSLIAFELYIMRIFSIGGWSNFGSLVISTALLGIGLSGIILTFITDWVTKQADRIMSICAITLAPAMTVAVLLAQLVPFNPVFLGADSRQIWFIAAYYIIYGVPFFIGAAFIGTAFIAMRDKIRHIYFWNMLGSATGGFVIILFMFILPPTLLLLPILGLSIIGAFFTSAVEDLETKKISFKFGTVVALSTLSIAALLVTLVWGGIRVSEYKAISYVRKYPDAKLVHHSFGPSGEYHVYASRYFHFAPGLSDNTALRIQNLPSQPFWGLFIDGSGPIGIMGALREEEKEYMDYLPMSAPYTVLAHPDVLLVNLSGGMNAQVAKYKGAASVDIVEPSREMIELLRDDPNVSRFTGSLLKSDGVHIMEGDPRSYCLENPGKYDLVEISLVDSIGLSDSGGYPVHENYTYTTEAFAEYLGSLAPGGILSLTIWDRLNPPRNVPRLMNTLITAMREDGIPDPEKRIYAFGLFMSTATILVKNGDFTEGEIYDLNNFIKTRTFEPLYYPGISAPSRHIDELTSVYRSHFEKNTESDIVGFTNSDMYRAAFMEFLGGRAAELEKGYVFDIRPIRDSRPYYSGFLKLNKLGTYLDQLPDISEEWGYLLILGIFLQSLLFGLLVICIPIIGNWHTLFKNRKGTIGVIVYYASLGLSYMLVELFLIQRFGIFLSNPTYSTSIVITVMLAFSAIGNLASGLFGKKHHALVVLGACVLIVGGLLFYIFGLDSFLSPFRSANMVSRILMSAIIIAPVALVMGVPYPNGLDSLQDTRPHLLPWAWGMNGGLSVAGAALARIISVSSGFPVLLGFALVLYALVGVIFRVNIGNDSLKGVE